MTHPIQPLVADGNGTTRFKKNAIVNYLLDSGTTDMNKLACMHFSNEDREQFAQLIGYSVSGFLELSYVSDETYDKVCNLERAFNGDSDQYDNSDIPDERTELEKKVEKLEYQVTKLQSILKALVGDLTMYSNLPTYIRNVIQAELTQEPEE